MAADKEVVGYVYRSNRNIINEYIIVDVIGKSVISVPCENMLYVKINQIEEGELEEYGGKNEYQELNGDGEE